MRLHHMLRVFAGATLLSVSEGVMALTWGDNFDVDGMDSSLWTYSSGGGPVAYETGGRLHMDYPANSGGSIFNSQYSGVPALVGDFDVTVDFGLDVWPSGSGVRVGMTVGGPSGYMTIERTNFAAGYPEMYYLDTTWGITGFESSDMAGTLRMTRVGTDITASVFTNGGWRPVGTFWMGGDEIGYMIWTWSHDAYFGHQPVSISFDNFRATDSAVPEPATWAVFGLGLAALMRRRR